jgi:myo-inositol-1(or 4)-monophosphatase
MSTAIPPDLETLTNLVITVAREELLPRFAETERRFKADGSVVTEADFVVQQRFAAELRKLCPQYDFLGEEMEDQRQKELLERCGAGLWCLDPVDGTSNFAAGIPFFGVSLALLVGRVPVLGIVYDPIRDECFAAERGRGARLNGTSLSCHPAGLPLSRCLAVVDFKRLDHGLATGLAWRPPYSSQRNFGSVALEWCWLAAGRFHVYLHGRQKLWDYAAGALILAEAGGHSATLRGEPVFDPALQPRSVVAAGDGQVFEEWRAWLAKAV